MTLVEELARARIGATFNFYRDGERAELRRRRLRAYLEARADAPVLLVAEAPGYRGTHMSGVPLTSERQLTGSGPVEATATIVHRALAETGLTRRVLLWNVVPTHPHLPGRPGTNRRPTRARGRGVASVRPPARARPARRPGGPARARGARRSVRPPSLARRSVAVPRSPA